MDEKRVKALMDEMRGQTLLIVDEVLYQNGVILKEIRDKLEFLVEEQQRILDGLNDQELGFTKLKRRTS